MLHLSRLSPFLLPLPPPSILLLLPPPFIVDGGEISVLFTQKIRAELGRRRLFCDDGDKIGDGGGVCVCVWMQLGVYAVLPRLISAAGGAAI